MLSGGADGTNPNLVMETGVYNLTQDQTEAMVHFGPEQTQTWLMVRLDESERPQDESVSAPAGSARGFNLNLPGVQLRIGNGVRVRAPGVNVATGADGTKVTAPAGVEVNTGEGGTKIAAPGVKVER